jgi:predicted deacylase
MSESKMYKTVVAVLVFAIAGMFWVLFSTQNKEAPSVSETQKSDKPEKITEVIGKSVEGRNIEATSYGSGENHIVFVGGIHGGYEWNSVVLAYELVDYFEANLEEVPKNMTVTFIPSANPDGAYKVVKKEGRFRESDIISGVPTAPGRFNANEVDINRNFDCKWKPKSQWQERTVSAGTKPFSEPETRAIRDFALSRKPKAFVFFHSQGNAVYASECQKGILAETLNIMNAYSKASRYKAIPMYDAYQTTGDADAWLAKIGIPAITVELKTHQSIDREENLSGVKALLQYYNEY